MILLICPTKNVIKQALSQGFKQQVRRSEESNTKRHQKACLDKQ